MWICDVLNADTGKEIYVDAEFDSTPYPMMRDYDDQQKRMTEDDFMEFLQNTLEENIGLSPAAARRC